MNEIILGEDQADALNRILEWYRDARWNAGTLTLGGYAGTGKTTLLGQLTRHLPPRTQVHFASYTGKAVSVLRKKLHGPESVTTLHRLLYRPTAKKICTKSKDVVPPGGKWCAKHFPTDPAEATLPPECETTSQLDWQSVESPLEGIDLVVVDEASMINEKIWSDLTKWGVPVLAVGDHGQLPPIKSEFNLMANPEIRLETILRQAAGSPIIQMATFARKHGVIPYRDFGGGNIKIKRRELGDFEMDPDVGDLIIVGYNRTRNELNESFREQLGRKGHPKQGDIVICLRNSYEHGIFNGMRGRVVEYETPMSFRGTTEESTYADIEMIDEGFNFTGNVSTEQWGQPKTLNSVGRHLNLFDYGYAMTCHKAQGSQADKVMVIEERLPSTDHRRWLYTAVTRAAKELIVVG